MQPIPQAELGVLRYPTLYKQDSVGRTRVWYMDLDSINGRYRTLSGLIDGQHAETAWTQAVPKSRDTAVEQATFEVEAQYKHQLDREYHDTLDSIGEAKIFEPMLAKTYSGVTFPVNAQPKLDGMRCIADINGLWTREGQPIKAVPHIWDALKHVFEIYPEAIFDGELYNHDLHDDFNEIMSIARKKDPTDEQKAIAAKIMQYHIYDLPSNAGGFKARSNLLFLMFTTQELGLPLVYVDTRWVTNQEELDQAYGEWLDNGYEGQMVRLNEPYQRGRRSKFLLKRKEETTEEFPIHSITAGAGNWAGIAKRVEVVLEDGQICGVGTRGKKEFLTNVLKNKDDYGFATVRYLNRTPDNMLRGGRVIDYHGRDGRHD